MKEISLRTPKPYGVRSNTNIEMLPKKKYFLVVEGSKTEIDYFMGIFNYRKDLDIDTLIDIIILDRDDENITDSHPKHLLSGTLKKMEEVNSELNYDSEIDEIWLIFDRDPGNFSEEQFGEIYSSCCKNKLNIGFTNPDFEFWLLLHLPDIKQYEEIKLLENKKVNKKRRFIEKELSDRLEGGYSKNNIRFERFKEKVDLAIQQEKLFEQDVNKILNALGSNIGVLISKMKND